MKVIIQEYKFMCNSNINESKDNNNSRAAQFAGGQQV